MEKETRIQSIIRRIASVGGDDPWVCGLQRLAIANGFDAAHAAARYYSLAQATDGLSISEVAGIARGWDEVAVPSRMRMWELSERLGGSDNNRDWVAVGTAAAKACGFGADSPHPLTASAASDGVPFPAADLPTAPLTSPAHAATAPVAAPVTAPALTRAPCKDRDLLAEWERLATSAIGARKAVPA